MGCPIHPAFGIGINVDEDKTLDGIRVGKLRGSRGKSEAGMTYPLPTELCPLQAPWGLLPTLVLTASPQAHTSKHCLGLGPAFCLSGLFFLISYSVSRQDVGPSSNTNSNYCGETVKDKCRSNGSGYPKL